MSIESVSVVEFDFKARIERSISVEEVCEACREGRSCWIDMNLETIADPAAILATLGINPVAAKDALGDSTSGRCDIYDDCYHISVGAPYLVDGKLNIASVNIILGEHFIVTMRRGEVGFIEQTQRGYRTFFAKFAETLGFLLFDLWDNLIESFHKALLQLEEEIATLQAEVLSDMDDNIFGRVNNETRHLLLLRKTVLANREILEQLAMRKTAFVPPTTQPYLANMVGTLERLSDDLTTEREILAELLSLYLGIVSHRTNRVVNRLTVVSLIFLPLSFLCGVYGMNFANIPELQWKYGIEYFWTLVATITISSLGFMKWKRWL